MKSNTNHLQIDEEDLYNLIEGQVEVDLEAYSDLRYIKSLADVIFDHLIGPASEDYCDDNNIDYDEFIYYLQTNKQYIYKLIYNEIDSQMQ